MQKDEGGEEAVGEAGGGGEEELYYHVVSIMGGGVGEDEVGGDGDENVKEKEGPEDYYVPSVRLVDTHPSEAGPEAPEIVASAGEAVCVHHARQQRFGVVAGDRFNDDASSLL
ncbi:hypothetical protein BHE74_00019156 [Ensete ventricosum]|nr:hypothetical protein BHE74_00019156 [Ensete ventricosum]